jgi:hypothetical protein
MPDHVGVDLKRQTSILAGPLDHPIEAVAIEWCPALVNENECRLRVLFSSQFPQRP